MGGRAVAWEELLPSLGRIAVAREVLASPGGRVLAWEGVLPSLGMVVVAGEVLASLGGRVLAWEGMLPSLGMIAVAREALASPGGRVLAWEGMHPSPAGGVCLGSGLINLNACLYNKVIYVCVSIVGPSYVSFLIVSKLNLFNCLCLTLLNLVSPTLSTKSWHSLSLCAEIIDASCDLHSSNCLEVLSRM